jgi:hypothetical protein
MIDGQQVDVKGTSGNMIAALGLDFTKLVFEGSFVGLDLIERLATGLVNNVVDSVFG